MITRVSSRGHLVDDVSLLLVAIIWGSSYVVMQVVGEHTPAAAFLMLRFVCALPAIALLALKTLRELTWNEVLTGTFFGTLLYGILIQETVGVRYTSAANAGFLITVSVVLIPALERVISGRKQLLIVYAATASALIGCGLLLLSDGFRPHSGDFIILGAAMVRATQITLFGRQTAGRRQSLVNLTLIEFVVVALLAGLTAVVSGEPLVSTITSTRPSAWLLIAYLGVMGTSFAFFVQLRSARASSSTRVGLILSTEPVFSALFAVAVAKDTLTPLQVIGGTLIVVSAAVGRMYEGRERPATESPQPSREAHESAHA
ncbi:DMT family transporter [Actinoallomurus sp. NBC_01490]|uniref:DMT family transporter n=1 Tax=Actinoallomurus sp. NBC_01490 TaxID=2903557 RepID=UPI002E2EC4EF|nr:DMT family transporter [Actinoallomurus sp. NBC_01490]